MALAAMNQVLVVAAHPYDEVLGCDGTIARHVVSGVQVQILMDTEVPPSHQKERHGPQGGGKHASLTCGYEAQAQIGIKAMHASYRLRQLL